MPGESVSIVIPVYNNQGTLKELVERISVSLKNDLFTKYEIIFVDDGSQDDSWEEIRRLSTANTGIVGMRLSKNFGQHSAIEAGFRQASMDYVCLMDADLQDAPELIREFMETLSKSNYDLVVAMQTNRKPFLHNFYHRINRYADQNPHASTFRVMSRKVVEAVLLHDYSGILYGPLSTSLGFRVGYISVHRPSRTDGKSSYTLKKKLRMVSQSLVQDIQRMQSIALVVLTFGFLAPALYGLVVMVERILADGSLPNGTTLILIILLFGFSAINFTFLVLFQIVGSLYSQTIRKPRFIVAEVL